MQKTRTSRRLGKTSALSNDFLVKEWRGAKNITNVAQDNCCCGVAYELSFSCGKVNVGQSTWCVNVGLREHALSLLGHLAVHVSDCGCDPLFSNAGILRWHQDKRPCKIYGAQAIATRGDTCTSALSVTLLKDLPHMQYFSLTSFLSFLYFFHFGSFIYSFYQFIISNTLFIKIPAIFG